MLFEEEERLGNISLGLMFFIYKIMIIIPLILVEDYIVMINQFILSDLQNINPYINIVNSKLG